MNLLRQITSILVLFLMLAQFAAAVPSAEAEPQGRANRPSFGRASGGGFNGGFGGFSGGIFRRAG